MQSSGSLSQLCNQMVLCLNSEIKWFSVSIFLYSHHSPGLIIDAFGELRDQYQQVVDDLEVCVLVPCNPTTGCWCPFSLLHAAPSPAPRLSDFDCLIVLYPARFDRSCWCPFSLPHAAPSPAPWLSDFWLSYCIIISCQVWSLMRLAS